MKLFTSLLAATAIALAALPAHANNGRIQGVLLEPQGKVKEAPTQLRIQFPEAMEKSEAFTVSCQPAMEGFSSWADNNTLWTFNFGSKAEEWREPRPVGGAKCQVQQVKEVKAVSGKIWPAAALNYSFTVDGPRVERVITGRTFKSTLRETNPVLLLTFNGPVNTERFFAERRGNLSYTSSNAPSEKISLVALPADQQEKVLGYFQEMRGSLKKEEQNWILATVNQNLIPGAQLMLEVAGQASLVNPDVISDTPFRQEVSVREQFKAEVICQNPSALEGYCLPQSPINVDLNGLVKWVDIKDAYIEYVPYKSENNIPVRSYAQIPAERKIGFWDWFLDYLAHYFPYLEKYSDTVVDQVVFEVSIEPRTVAKVVIPQNLADLDGRVLANALSDYPVRISGMAEFLQMPERVSFFEKEIENPFLPVGVVNLNQKLLIRKLGTEAGQWQPVREFDRMIQLVKAYSVAGEYREGKDYTSPMQQAGFPSTVVEQTLTGRMDRTTVLQFPFGRKESGLYAVEVSSPTLEDSLSDPKNDSYYNPKHALAQVTDLAVHLKKGKDSSMAWVTSLSTGRPVAGAQVEIYNCLGERKAALETDAAGLASFPNQNWAQGCGQEEGQYSEYLTATEYFVGVRKGEDMALVHSSWISPGSYALGAPGIDWFYSRIQENEPNFHAILGVNLVKPGQKVPVEVLAKIPDGQGFREVPAADLPQVARVVNSDDEEVFFEFPLSWQNGRATFQWNVPADEAVTLGQYNVMLVNRVKERQYLAGEIEVAEFKVPLMTGLLNLPRESLVKPASLPVNAVVRYANGVGAKGLGMDLSFYFSSASISQPKLPGFVFGSGPATVTGSERDLDQSGLPETERPYRIEGLKTRDDGSLAKDIAEERLADGRTVGEALQSLNAPKRLVVRARYLDQMGEYQTLSQAKEVHSSSFYVGTRVVSGVRAKARLQAAVVDVEERIQADPSAFEYKVIRIETKVIGEELFGGLIKNTLEREMKPVRWESDCRLEGNVVSCAVGALKEGSYAFQVTHKASQQSAHHLFKVDVDGRVYGPNEYRNSEDEEASKQLPLTLDKETYQNGDRAVVSFAAPFRSCSALVTVERSDVMDSFVVPGACEKGKVEVPVSSTQAPNAFISVYAVTGRAADSTASVGDLDFGRPTYRLGFANMRVDWSRFTSAVSVKTEKEKYQPGETVNVEVKVDAAQGSLKGGTVTLVALEEKILELKANDTYKVLEALMQMRNHSVETITALERIETVVSAGDADLPAAAPRKGGDEGGDGSSRSEFKRKLFDALVTFQPGIPVVNGVAKASFKANDSLTRFKVFAIALDSSQKFGTGEAVYLSEKDTQVYANLPQVSYTGDQYPARVTVQNNTSKDGKFRAEITYVVRDRNGNIIETKTLSKEALIGKSASSTLDLGELAVGDQAGRIDYTVRIFDENGKLVDVLEPAPQMILASVPLVVRDSFLLQMDSRSVAKTLAKEEGALAGQGRIQVVASRSLVSSAIQQISQRLERDPFADFFLSSKFARAFLRSSEKEPDALKAVLESMVNLVDQEGFLKLYPQSRMGSLWMTGAILNSLQLEPWAMSQMPASMKARLKAGVEKVLDRKVDADYVGRTPLDWARAQILMARSAFAFGDAELQAKAREVAAAVLAEFSKSKSPFGLAVEKWTNQDLLDLWHLEAIMAEGNAGRSAIFRQLTSTARLVHTGNAAQLKGAPAFRGFYSDETMETASLITGLSRIKGDKNLAKSLAMGLVNASKAGWYNSFTMLTVAQGLKAFGKTYEQEKVAGVLAIEIPEERASGTVDLTEKSFGGFQSDWGSSKATVRFDHRGQGKPWLSLQALSAVPLKEARTQGMKVEKSLRNLTRDSGFQAGDVIEVVLEISTNAPIQHVALVDPIPAGSNIVGEAYGDHSSGQKSYAGYKLHFDSIYSSSVKVKYQYQLNNPGRFQLPPTRAEGVFLPSVFAEVPNSVMQVE